MQPHGTRPRTNRQPPGRQLRTTQILLALLPLLALAPYAMNVPRIVRLLILPVLLMRAAWEIARLLRRQRPRRRMRTTALMSGTLALVFACMAAAIAAEAETEWPAFAVLALLLLATCGGSLVRYRRLAAEASLRLEQLRRMRRRDKNRTRIG